ncbi:MAG: glycerophosphodiester phosphodiesterase [Candidatus Methylomirabilia bacterium]
MTLLVLSGLLLGLCLAAVVGVPAAGRAEGTLLAAHRGGARLWPENSLLAFKNVLALGVDLIEFDVHLTQDGRVVVLHDPTLERTTTGIGEVRAAKLAELRQVRLKDRDGTETEEPVPTLEELLDLVASTPVRILLEIKTGPRRERYEGIEEKVLGLLRVRGLADRTVIMSFHTAIIRRVHDLDPTIRTSLLISERTLEREGVGLETALGWATSAGATDIGVQYTMVTRESLAAARARGLRVGAWTVNDERGMRRMIELGVDTLITDRPDVAKTLLGR